MPEAEVTPETDPAAAGAVDEFADPEPLAEGVAQFPREYVEELRQREAKYRIRARDTHKQLEEFGGPDAIKEAVEWRQSLQTEEGVISMFVESGRSLGLGIKDLEAMFAQPGGVEAVIDAAAGQTGPADDDVLTWKEARALIEKEVKAPQEQQRLQQLQHDAQRVIAVEREALGLTDQADYEAVLSFGQKHLRDGDFDPAHIQAAMRKGYAEFEALATRRAEAYLAQKAKDKATVPSSTGAGAAPGGTTLPEPANMDEAKARARAALKAAGA
jgi:hypothetical protein